MGHRACQSPAVGVARNLPQRARISAPRRPDAEVRNGASGTTFCRDRLTITVDNIALREARERDSLAARYLPGCVAASLPNAKSSSITGSQRIRSTNDISRCCRQPQSSAAPIPSGPTRTIDHVARSQSSSHSFVRSERAPFLRSGQELQRHRAQRRSRMVTKPARQRFTIDGRDHDGRLATSRDGDVHRCDPGRIDAVGQCSARRAGVVDCAPAKRFDRPSLRDIRHRGVEALRSAGTLFTRRHARRKRWRTARGAHVTDADYAGNMERVAVSLPSRR